MFPDRRSEDCARRRRKEGNLIHINSFAKPMESQAKFLREQAERCRRLAGQLTDRELARTLLDLGEDYAAKARAWDAATSGRDDAGRISEPATPPMAERH
jgi:hypothetical protein